MPDVPTEFPDPREHRRIIARAINEALDRVGASADDVPIDFPNPTEHRRIMATAVNEQLQELQLDSIKVRFDYDREHRRIIAAAVNLLFKAIEDEPPPVGATLETTSVISAASTITSESNVSSTPNPTGTFFDTGLRRLHCSQLGNPPLDGTTPDLTFTNLQTALNAVIAGDVLTVAAETFTGSFSLNNAAGTEDEPIWITAEVRGETIISNLIQSVKNGTQTWTSDGAGIFSISGSRPYIGSDLSNGEFLPGYVQVSDINAPTIPTDTGPNNPSGSINKPQRGFAFSGGRIRLKVTGGSNPTGRPIALTQGFDFQQMSWNNADNCILDGFLFEGAGDGAALSINENCRSPEIRNCVFNYCQFGVRAAADDTLLKRCEYLTEGTEEWQLTLRALNGQGTNAAFRYAKNYYNAGNLGINNNFSDALLEGGFDVAIFNGRPAVDVVIDECYLHDTFEGSKAGRHRNAIVRNCVLASCLDDGIELEAPAGSIAPESARNAAVSQVHDCLFRNCFSPVSYQGTFTHRNTHLYRNVVIVDDLNIVHPPFFLKMIFTPSDVNLNVYQNIFINPSTNADGNEGFGSNHWVWFAFSNSTAERIRNFFNNIVMFENDLDQTFQTNNLPAGRSNNAVVSPANNTASAQVQGSNGVFAGNSNADMGLNADFSLQAGSPARGLGKARPAGLPDTGVNNDDAGVFPFGETVPANWPREEFRAFDTSVPDRWTSPGA